MKISELMTPNPQSVYPTDMLSVVEEKMRNGRFRRVPVVDEAGKLLGILSDGDLREHVGYLATTRVTAAMVENPITISAEAPVGSAADLMRWNKIGGLPVVDGEGRLVGIITESDLLLALAETAFRRRDQDAAPRSCDR
jgi:CBS domain-containing protein